MPAHASRPGFVNLNMYLRVSICAQKYICNLGTCFPIAVHPKLSG